MINDSTKGVLDRNYSFDDKIKEVCRENPFRPASSSAGAFYISNTDNGLHIFIGNESESNFNATITNKDGVTVNINNDSVSPMQDSLEDDVANVDEIKKGASGFFSKAQETFGYIKKVIDKVNEATEGVKTAYKKTTKAMSKMFVAVAIVSSFAQVGNMASIAHSNDYSWQPTMTELGDYYAPIYEDFDKNKDIYSICPQDKSLCLASGALVAVAATKSMALTGTGAALMVAGDVSEDQTRLNTFLQSVEKATGYALTKETSEERRLEREGASQSTPLHNRETQETSHRIESASAGDTPLPSNNESLERTKVNDRTRDIAEIPVDSNRINKRNYNRGQSLNM
jgi:hypothetical protein